MKRSAFPVLFVGALLLVSAAGTALAEGKSVAIPKGTKCEKLGPGSFKLTTPDGTVFSITSFKKAAKPQAAPGTAGILGDCGIIGDCGIRDAKGKLIATGTNGVLKAMAGKAVKGAPPTDYIKIDDEVTWLPAIIEFPSIRIFNRQALIKLSPQPDPPGKG
jgi:hypothetical protein